MTALSLGCQVQIQYFAKEGQKLLMSKQVQMEDLVKGGAQLLRPKVVDVVEWSHMSEASYLWLGSRALKQALEAFGVLMLNMHSPTF